MQDLKVILHHLSSRTAADLQHLCSIPAAGLQQVCSTVKQRLDLETSNLVFSIYRWFCSSSWAGQLQVCSISAAELQQVCSILKHRLDLETSNLVCSIYSWFCSSSAAGQKKDYRISAAGIQQFCSTNLKNNKEISLGPALYRSCTCLKENMEGKWSHFLLCMKNLTNSKGL